MQADASLNRVQWLKNQEVIFTHANYVKWEHFLLPPCQSIAFVVASASSETHAITIEEKKMIHSIAFAVFALGLLEVGTSNSMEHLFPRQILIKRQIIENLKNR